MPRVQHSSERSVRSWWALLIVVLCVVGCDSRVYYKPLGWERHGDDEWASPTHGFVLYTAGPLGLVGAPDALFEMEVVNRGADPVIFDDCVLKTRKQQYVSHAGSEQGSLVSRTVPGGQTKSVAVLFPFDEPNTRILGESFELAVRYHIGMGPVQSLNAKFVEE